MKKYILLLFALVMISAIESVAQIRSLKQAMELQMPKSESDGYC